MRSPVRSRSPPPTPSISPGNFFMSYRVLARKYRPQTFDDLIGQAHVATTLTNAIKSQKIAHAYLFSGPRGVGKTTSARILAKALNCAKGPTPTPCNACDFCKRIAE